MPRFGGAEALTKHIHDEALKNTLTLEDTKVEVISKTTDNSMVISGSHIVHKPKNKIKVRMVRKKMPVKKTSRLERATRSLYDLEEAHGPEKPLNIDFGLYQMEDF